MGCGRDNGHRQSALDFIDDVPSKKAETSLPLPTVSSNERNSTLDVIELSSEGFQLRVNDGIGWGCDRFVSSRELALTR